jgi:hypothetical protein
LSGSQFCFQAKSLEDKEAWIGAIGKLYNGINIL